MNYEGTQALLKTLLVEPFYATKDTRDRIGIESSDSMLSMLEISDKESNMLRMSALKLNSYIHYRTRELSSASFRDLPSFGILDFK